jgi:hypothetical protein
MILHIEDKGEARSYIRRLGLDSTTFCLFHTSINGNLFLIRDIYFAIPVCHDARRTMYTRHNQKTHILASRETRPENSYQLNIETSCSILLRN